MANLIAIELRTGLDQRGQFGLLLCRQPRSRPHRLARPQSRRSEPSSTSASANIRRATVLSETTDPNWRKAHNVLMPAFSMDAMHAYYPRMLDIAVQLIQIKRLNPDDTVDALADMTRRALSVGATYPGRFYPPRMRCSILAAGPPARKLRVPDVPAAMLFHGPIVSTMILIPAIALSIWRLTLSTSDFKNSCIF